MIDLIKRSNFCLETFFLSLTVCELQPPSSEFVQQTKIALWSVLIPLYIHNVSEFVEFSVS